jgi:hypothetical protein
MIYLVKMFRLFRQCTDSVQTFQTMFRICSDFSDNVQNVQNLFGMFRFFRHVQTLFRICSEFSVNVQNVQTLFRMFRLFRQCSDNVQNVQNLFRIFSQCSECSESVQTFSEFLAQKLVYSEFLDFVVIPISTKQAINSHWTPKIPRHMTLEIQVLVWDRDKNVGRINRLWDPSPPLLIAGSPPAINIKTNKKKKNLPRFACTHKKTIHYHKN